MLFHPFLQSDSKGVRPPIIEVSAFFSPRSELGHLYHAGVSFGVILQHNKHYSWVDFLSFKQQLRLKGQGESHAAWDGGTGGDLGGSNSRKSN